MDQKRPEIGVSSLGNPEENVLAKAGVLLGKKAQIRR